MAVKPLQGNDLELFIKKMSLTKKKLFSPSLRKTHELMPELEKKALQEFYRLSFYNMGQMRLALSPILTRLGLPPAHGNKINLRHLVPLSKALAPNILRRKVSQLLNRTKRYWRGERMVALKKHYNELLTEAEKPWSPSNAETYSPRSFYNVLKEEGEQKKRGRKTDSHMDCIAVHAIDLGQLSEKQRGGQHCLLMIMDRMTGFLRVKHYKALNPSQLQSVVRKFLINLEEKFGVKRNRLRFVSKKDSGNDESRVSTPLSSALLMAPKELADLFNEEVNGSHPLEVELETPITYQQEARLPKKVMMRWISKRNNLVSQLNLYNLGQGENYTGPILALFQWQEELAAIRHGTKPKISDLKRLMRQM